MSRVLCHQLNMRLVLIVTVIVVVLQRLEAAQFIIPYEEGKPGYCFDEEIGALENGQVVPYGHCARAMCANDRSIVVQSCGALLAECGTTEDLSKPYPDCCPKPKDC